MASNPTKVTTVGKVDVFLNENGRFVIDHAGKKVSKPSLDAMKRYIKDNLLSVVPLDPPVKALMYSRYGRSLREVSLTGIDLNENRFVDQAGALHLSLVYPYDEAKVKRHGEIRRQIIELEREMDALFDENGWLSVNTVMKERGIEG